MKVSPSDVEAIRTTMLANAGSCIQASELETHLWMTNLDLDELCEPDEKVDEPDINHWTGTVSIIHTRTIRPAILEEYKSRCAYTADLRKRAAMYKEELNIWAEEAMRIVVLEEAQPSDPPMFSPRGV